MECKHKIQLKSGDIVPCGRCPVCKANQRQEWVFRLREEQRVSAFSLFVTLTYNDEHIPPDYSVNKRDVQLFFKRLRKRIGSFRYYFVSEYGDNTYRPHYHGLFFFKHTCNKREVYDSITDAWANGFCSFGDVEEGSIVYCTKYCLKKNSVPPGRKDNFRLVSKMNGGLGISYLSRMSSWHIETQNLNFASSFGVRCRMPKYYKDKLIGHILKDFPDYRIEREQMSYQSRNKEFLDAFKEFCRANRFDTFEEASKAFNFERVKRAERNENLIVKHTKKQRF